MEVIENKSQFGELVNIIRGTNEYRDPIMFGIAKIDSGVSDSSLVLQANYLTCNVGEENLGSAAIYNRVLSNIFKETGGASVLHSTDNELVIKVSNLFIDKALKLFAPYVEEATGDAHLNVQVLKILSDINRQLIEQDIGTLDDDNPAISYHLTFIYNDAPVETVEAGYLKLYALSKGKSKIRSLNLDGLFGKLTNCAWVNGKPTELDYLRENEMELKAIGRYPKIDYVDKFPLMLQHVVPADDIHVLDAKKVCMGAQLAAGTTVMPGASYINFNAGTEGPVMVEGRISSSVIVGAGSNIGGGASISGALSGTDGNPILIGKNCLLGANSVCGIPLGDDCIIDAGTTVLPNTPITVSHDVYNDIKEVNKDHARDIFIDEDGLLFYAKEFAGMNGLHFRSDAITGKMILKRNTKK